MAPYLELVLGFYSLVYLFRLYVDLRQWSKFRNKDRPTALSKVISEEEYKKS